MLALLSVYKQYIRYIAYQTYYDALIQQEQHRAKKEQCFKQIRIRFDSEKYYFNYAYQIYGLRRGISSYGFE
jgi:hypothetical protein